MSSGRAPRSARPRLPRIGLGLRSRPEWIAALVFWVVFSGLAIVKYASYHTAVDLGIFTQALSSGGFALRDRVEGGSHFAYHFSPVLYLCVPVLALARSAVALQIVQALAGALVAPAVYRIAARVVPLRTALVLACVALAYPPLAAVTFVDFHENAFVAPLVLWLASAVLERRLGRAAACAVALLLVKEDEALVLAFAATATGAWALRAGERRLAVACAAAVLVALGTFGAYFAWLQPLAANGHAWEPLRFYASASRGPEVPYASGARVGYVLEALYPLLFTPLFSKRIVFVLPGMLEDVLSRQALPFSMNSHYPAVWLPWMLFAAVGGVATLRRRHPVRLRGVACAALVVCAAALVFASPTHWRKYLSWPGAHEAALERRLAALGSHVSVGTQDEIFAHLAFDPNARVGLGRPGEPRPALVVIDESRAGDSYFVPVLERAVAGTRSGYELVARADAIAVYRRAAAEAFRGCENKARVEPLIITVAPVGAELAPDQTPHLPVTPAALGRTAAACERAGASIVHVHCRTDDGANTHDTARFAEAAAAIRAASDLIVQFSTGGAIGMTPEERAAPLSLGPEMATLSCGTVNFGDDVFENSFPIMRGILAAMTRYGVRPELEIFDLAHLANARRLEREGMLAFPQHADFVLGIPGALEATAENLVELVRRLPAGCTWSVAATGRDQLPMAAIAIAMGGHVRVGLEDNIYYRRGELATNDALVARVARLSAELERPVATPAEARRILGLTGVAAVGA